MVIAAEAARAVEDGVGSVVILADLDPRLDEMSAQRARWDLQFQSMERDAIVVADLALLLDAEDLAEIDTVDRNEGIAILLGWTANRALWAGM